MTTEPLIDNPSDAQAPCALIATFADVDSVMAAAEQLRDQGFCRWDVHSPFPIHGINRAMGLRPTILPWIALVHGIVGCLGGLLLVWYTNATTFAFVPTPLQGYEYLISGKPIFSLPANVAIVFETTILLAAFGTVLGMLGLNKLPMLSNPLLRSANFRRVTTDALIVVIETDDPLFDAQRTPMVLRELGSVQQEWIYP